jgi:hypothetical protein
MEDPHYRNTILTVCKSVAIGNGQITGGVSQEYHALWTGMTMVGSE